MSGLAKLQKYVEGASILNRALLRDVDVDACLEQRSSASMMFSHVIRAKQALGYRVHDQQIELPAEEISRLGKTVEQRIKASLTPANLRTCGIDADPFEELFCRAIRSDLEALAKSLCTGFNDPVLNGLWIAYLAGHVPSRSLEVDGDLAKLLDVTPAEARRLFKEAEKRADIAEAQAKVAAAKAKAERERVEREVAETVGMPSGDLLKRALRSLNLPELEAPETRIITEPGQLDGVAIPAAWRALVEAQAAGKPLPWSKVWKTSERLFPPVSAFLREKCLGVAVLAIRDRPPALLYVFRFAMEEGSNPTAVSAFLGGYPVGKKIPPELQRKFNCLPPSLQEFYQTVHDGWVEYQFMSHGPEPLAGMTFIGELIGQNLRIKPRGKDPYQLDDLLEVAGNGFGDGLCIDTAWIGEPEEPRGIFYFHEEPRKSLVDLDFWAKLNEMIEAGTADALPRSKEQR